MTDYTKSTTFSAKDALPSGHPSKKILGSLFDTEFDNISVAISTKLETGDSASFASGTTVADVTFTAGTLETASPVLTLNNDVSITGNITVSGTVDGRDVATDGAKLDGIEAGATGDQTAAEIKTAYESNADTNAYTDAEKTKLGTVETGADVTDATNVDAAGAVMNSDATTAAMSFVIDEDNLASNLDTKVPTQQSVKAYVDATVVAIGGLTIDEPVATGEFGVFTSASTIGGQTPAEVRASLDLEVGTDVQAWDADLDTIAALTPTDGHFLQYSGGTWTSAEVQTDPTLGTLTKTFTTNEQSTITLSSSLTGAPVVSVTKEIPQVGVSNGEWDVNSTTENYTRTNSAPATTLDFAGSFDVANATFLDSFDVSGQFVSPRSVTFNTDGTKMYVLADNVYDSVYQYTLSTAFDTSTASYDSVSFSVAAQDTNPTSLQFNTDGTKMFVTGDAGNDVSEYALSTGFDISTTSFTRSFIVNAQETSPWGLTFNTDGTKMYVIGTSSDWVSEYTLTTGFDLATASHSQNFSVSAQETNPRDVAFNTDGTKMFVVGDQNPDSVWIYNLSTGFDVSTASFDTSIDVSAQDTSTLGIEFNTDGTKMYLVGGNDDTIDQYELPTKLQLGTGSFASADIGKTIEANSGVFVLTATDGSYSETTAPTSYNQVASGDWGMYAVVYNTTDGDLELSTYGEVFNTSFNSYSQSFSVTTQEISPNGLAFSTDGTKMFVCGNSGDDVNEYTLSTAFDVSTASFVDSFLISGQDTLPEGITFNPDGTKMFVVGDTGNDINEYTLSTGFDVSTATFVDSFSVGTQETSPRGVAFNTDGTKMFVCGTSSDSVHEYSLTTGFDVSTATFSQTFSTVGEVPNTYGLTFNTDGTKMFVVGYGGASRVAEYTLTTGFDISTASHLQSTTIAEDGIAVEIKFNPSGTKFFILGKANDTVYEYDIASTPVSGYHAVHTTVSTDSTYWTDINSMTVDEDTGAGSVYYAVSTDDRTTWSVIDNTDGVRDIVRNSGGTWQYNSNGTYGSETWTAGTTNTELATLEEAMSVTVVDPYTITDVTFVDGFSVTTEDINPTSLAFNSDGTKMFVAGYTGQDVNEYSLSTAYDVSTASYTQNFSVASKETQPWGINFNTDGTKMFVTGQASKNLHEYDLTTGFDVSTASFSQTLSLGLGVNLPVSIEFNSSGTLMYLLVSGTTDYVYRYTLSTGFDISTASASDQNFSVTTEETSPYGLVFNNDGTKFYIAGNTGDDITEYSLSTAYDLTTASATGVTFSTVSQTAQPVAMRWNGDGSKFFVLGLDNDEIYEYALNPTDSPNQMDKTQLEAVTDANHFTLGNDLDLAIIFNQTASGLAPSSDGVSINYDANTLEQGAVLGTDYNWDNPASDKVRITALQAGNYKVRVV